MKRPTPLAGSWFPDNGDTLAALLESWRDVPIGTEHSPQTDETSPAHIEGVSLPLGDSPSSNPSLPIGAILVPHAGYAYSGATATRVYAQLSKNAYDTVIILAPSHRVAMTNTFSVEPADEIVTPLGSITFDSTLHDTLLTLPGATYLKAAHDNEHSVHIQLPMIQHFIGSCQLGAIVMGQWAWDSNPNQLALARLAAAFKKILTPRTLMVISSDFTHYGPQFGYVPFKDNVAHNIRRLDSNIFEQFASCSNSRFTDILQATKATVCGKAPMSLLLAMLPDDAEITKIDYTTSGDETGDFSHSVSYMGALIKTNWDDALKLNVHMLLGAPTDPASPGTASDASASDASASRHTDTLKPGTLKQGTPTQGKQTPQNPIQETVQAISQCEDIQGLSPAAQHQVLQLARLSLVHAVRHNAPCPLPKDVNPELQAHRGAFVTLHLDGMLRGCIGEIMPSRPLAQVVIDRACDAALHDSRFHPVRPKELSSIALDVSVLSEPHEVDSPEHIVLGKHGIVLQKNGYSAVFLPQVAPEQHWDLPTTLTQLSLKAGLPPHAWRTGARFFVFTAQVLMEEAEMAMTLR